MSLELYKLHFHYIVMRLLAIGVFLLPLLLMANLLHAEDDDISGRFAVSFVPSDGQDPWIAKALEFNVYNDLSGYARIIPIAKIEDEAQQCRRANVECLLDIYQVLALDALMLGRVTPKAIEFEVYDVKKRALVKTGHISIERGATLLQLRMGAFAAFKAFLAKGGILERRQYAGREEGEGSVFNGQSAEVESNKLRQQILLALAIFICFPYVFSLFGKPRRHRQRRGICLRWFLPFMLICASALIFVYWLDAAKHIQVSAFTQKFMEDYHWAVVALGGLLWGYFLIANLSLIHPHFHGLERIEQKTLLPLLESYLITFLVKLAFLLGVYSLVFYALHNIAYVFAVPEQITTLLVLPLSGLVALCWLGLVLEVMAMSLDSRLSKRGDDYVEVWDAKLRKYFISYLKRNGIILNENLLSQLIFLVGENHDEENHAAMDHGVLCYGGLFSRPRIVVDYVLLRYALGDNSPVIQEYNRPRTKHSTMSLFIPHIFPRLRGKSRRMRKHKKLSLLADLEAARLCDLNHGASTLKIGQDKVMKGIILPRFGDQDHLPSLMSDNLEDMSIVEELMQEDTVKSDPFDEDAEIDDSSFDDKDFLFGMLLHKYGELFRYDHLFSTVYMYLFKQRLAKGKPYHFPLAEYFSRVADTFVVINSGLNHLLQYLYYRETKVSSLLTTKGSPDDLLESQHKILSDVAALSDGRKTKAYRFDRLDRLIWLSHFCKEPIDARKIAQVRKPLVWLFSFTLIFLMSTVFLRSYNYHPKYKEIIAFEKHEIAENIRAAQEQERKKNDR